MFPKIVVKPPKWVVKIMVPNPIKMDALGDKKPYFWKHPHGNHLPHQKWTKRKPCTFHRSWSASHSRMVPKHPFKLGCVCESIHRCMAHNTELHPTSQNETAPVGPPPAHDPVDQNAWQAAQRLLCRSVSCWYGIFHSSF